MSDWGNLRALAESKMGVFANSQWREIRNIARNGENNNISDFDKIITLADERVTDNKNCLGCHTELSSAWSDVKRYAEAEKEASNCCGCGSLMMITFPIALATAVAAVTATTKVNSINTETKEPTPIIQIGKQETQHELFSRMAEKYSTQLLKQNIRG